MSDSRWLEIERDMQDGVAHLERAIALFDSTDMAGDDLRAYADRMGFMHAMQAGYTSLENGLKRLLDALGSVGDHRSCSCVAARWIMAVKLVSVLSERTATRLNSLSWQKKFSIRWRQV